MINKLRAVFTRRDKKVLFLLLLFSIVISIIETVGVSIIMPFIAVATDFSVIETNQYYQYVYKLFSFKSYKDFIIFFGLLLVLFYIFRSIVNLLYFYMLNKFTFGRYYLLAYRLFENYMGMSYKNFVKKNSSNLTKSIVNEAQNLTSLVQSILFMASEFFVIVFLYAMLLYVNYKVTLMLTLILLISGFILTSTVSKMVKNAGTKRSNVQIKFYDIINKSLGNFKLIKLQTNDKILLNEFGEASMAYAEANISAQTLFHIPRLTLEAIGFGLIVIVITYLVWMYEKDISSVLAIISMFVLALYRILPSVNRIMSGYNNILFLHKSLDIVHNDLMYDTENLDSLSVNFKKDIKLEKVSFEYEEDKLVLNSVDLVIRKGEKIAFIGESGSGKSTLVDILIGLYKPKSGNIEIDGVLLEDCNIKAWRQKIGYIPQSVYLFNGSVAENVVFGRVYDENKIIESLKQAQIYDFLNEKDGINTVVGEGGVLLSGGQKQRIAIARALYGDPEVLVLDEATSALDNKTESDIMDEIYKASLDRTLIIIAHRLSTIDRCEKIYKVQNGEIKNV